MALSIDNVCFSFFTLNIKVIDNVDVIKRFIERITIRAPVIANNNNNEMIPLSVEQRGCRQTQCKYKHKYKHKYKDKSNDKYTIKT